MKAYSKKRKHRFVAIKDSSSANPAIQPAAWVSQQCCWLPASQDWCF